MKDCDLVMKGGIASGVVYPKAISELAKEYRFRSIGGTSAGAIAAGLAAAAEYGRQSGKDNSGFVSLGKELPDEIGKCLKDLFQPHKKHKRLFKKILKLMNKDSKSPFLFAVLNFFKIKKSVKYLPDTDYGFCSGMSMDGYDKPGLTDWLNFWIEKSANRLTSKNLLPVKPLTFGMLREKEIKLRMMTTNLSKQEAVVLPFQQKINCADIEDLKRLFPENVVDYLIDYHDTNNGKRISLGDKSLIQLPTGDDMPVLMAVRMSLSFPVLLTAIPIYQSDHSRVQLSEDEMKIPRKCWFSDGGISSNFPIHLFDSFFPNRPTFGISLNEFHSDRNKNDLGDEPGMNRIYLPYKAGQGRLKPIDTIEKLGTFVMSIFNTAQNWQDKSQSVLPGYTDRIVRIALKGNEGGMNLNMKEHIIHNLVKLGGHAADEIKDNFDFDQHRFRRLLSSYAAIEIGMMDMIEQYEKSDSAESIPDFIERYKQNFTAGDDCKNYKPKNIEELEELENRVEELIRLAYKWKQNTLHDNWGCNTMPKPNTVLRLVPGDIYRH